MPQKWSHEQAKWAAFQENLEKGIRKDREMSISAAWKHWAQRGETKRTGKQVRKQGAFHFIFMAAPPRNREPRH